MKRSILAVLLVVGIFMLMGGCVGGPQAEEADPDALKGEITVAGSTSVQPLSELLAAAFMKENPGVRVIVQGGGSGVGIEQANNGTVDIGASSRELKEEEKGLGLIETCIARDGIALVVHPDNPINGLKVEQIRDIFSGKITNWKELRGNSGNIVVINRESASGTRGAFEELIMGKDAKLIKSIEQNSTGAVRTAVAMDKNAVGYVSLTGLSSDVKALKVNEAEATAENIQAGAYPVNRPFLYLTKGEQSNIVKAYLKFASSDKARQIIAEEGLVQAK